MRAFIDTNIFVYATSTKFPQFARCRDFLKSCLAGWDSWFVSWGVVYEYLGVVTRPHLFPDAVLSLSEAIENILHFIQSPQVEVIQETPEHVRYLQEVDLESQPVSGRIIHDAHIVVLMKEHDLRTIYTADADFNRFKGIEAINPL